MKKIEYRTLLLIIFTGWWLFWAYSPVHFSDWVLENILTVIFIPFLIFTRNRFRLSSVSYTTIFIFMILHTVGSHYTYAEVPYEDWTKSIGFSFKEIFNFERNHYDRLVHFSFGLLFAYPVREIFNRIGNIKGLWSYYFPLELVMAQSMIYELIEWVAAVAVGGELGQAYLGTQGDIWDAHKDMGLATLGAAIGMAIVALINWKYQRNFTDEFKESIKIKEKKPLGEVKLREYRSDRDKEK